MKIQKSLNILTPLPEEPFSQVNPGPRVLLFASNGQYCCKYILAAKKNIKKKYLVEASLVPRVQSDEALKDPQSPA